MKSFITLLVLSSFLLSSQAHSRDDKLMMSIQDTLASDDFKARLDPNIQLFFADQTHNKVTRSFGTFPTNKKTNSFGKSAEKACRWVFLSTLLSLQERARSEGGNAVINIANYYKKDLNPSQTEFECHDGALLNGVALIGEIVTLEK